MGLKKGYFKGLQNGVNNSPIRKDRNGVDKKKSIVDPRNTYTTEEIQSLDPRQVTPQMVNQMNAPTTEQDYNARTYIRPYANNKDDDTTLEKGVNFAYNNPNTISMAMKIPYLKERLIEETKDKMRASGGSGSTNLKSLDPSLQKENYELYLKEYNQEVADGYTLPPPNTFEDYVTESTSDNTYDGTSLGANSNPWNDTKANPIDQFFSKEDLYEKSPYTPKSDFYEWQNRYSVKGKDFDKNANNFQIGKNMGTDLTRELAFKGYEKNKPKNIKETEEIINKGNNPSFEQRQELNDWNESFDSKSQEDAYNKTNYYDNLTNAQLVPFQIENSMMQTPYFQNLNAENEGYRGQDYGQMGGYAPNPVMDEAFESLYSGEKPVIYGSGAEDGQVSNFMNTDYGRQRTGFGMDNKLPYMSTSDSWDFQATGKGGYDDNWSEGGGEPTSEFKQSQLVNQVAQEAGAGGFKLYDRFYFTPDKYKDYIKDEDVDFMQEFYGADMGDNLNNIKPEMLEEVILTTKRNEKKSPGSTKFNRLNNKE